MPLSHDIFNCFGPLLPVHVAPSFQIWHYIHVHACLKFQHTGITLVFIQMCTNLHIVVLIHKWRRILCFGQHSFECYVIVVLNCLTKERLKCLIRFDWNLRWKSMNSLGLSRVSSLYDHQAISKAYKHLHLSSITCMYRYMMIWSHRPISYCCLFYEKKLFQCAYGTAGQYISIKVSTVHC